MLTEEEAVARAKEAIEGLATIQPDSTVEVKRRRKKYIVTFVRFNPPGVRGPDFDAKVTLDAETGEILEILGAS